MRKVIIIAIIALLHGDVFSMETNQKHWNFLQANKDKRYVFSIGGSRSGKSFTNIQYYITKMAFPFKGKHLVVRKTLKSLRMSTEPVFLEILEAQKIRHRMHDRDRILHVNGHKTWFLGIDNQERLKSLGVHDAYMEELTEFILRDYLQVDNRISEIAPYVNQLLGSTNPINPSSYVYKLAVTHKDAKTAVLHSTYKDNIRFISEGTPAQLERLKHIDPTFYKIYALGEWAAVEGLVYPIFDREIHVLSSNDESDKYWKRPDNWSQLRKFRAIDLGYINPFVCLWFVELENGEIVIYDEHHKREKDLDYHSAVIRAKSHYKKNKPSELFTDGELSAVIERELCSIKGEKLDAKKLMEISGKAGLREDLINKLFANLQEEEYLFTASDHDAQQRAELRKYGVNTVKAVKAVSAGINSVRQYLAVGGNGRPGLSILDVCVNLLKEVAMYKYNDKVEGKEDKEEPVKLNDHTMDAKRYGIHLYNLRYAPYKRGETVDFYI